MIQANTVGRKIMITELEKVTDFTDKYVSNNFLAVVQGCLVSPLEGLHSSVGFKIFHFCMTPFPII
jgi:hypothetical protein